MPMDPGQLRLLALIERHGSLTGAARALGLTPAAVTQQVARAERDWTVPLVHRGPRGATLTVAGALLAGHGRVIEEETGKAEDALAALLGHLSLRLRVGAFQAAALHLLPPALTALRHRHPDADVSVIDVVSDRGIDEVADGRLDLAVIASWGIPLAPPPQVKVHSLLHDPMVVVLPDDHPLITKSPNENPAELRLDQLRDESWVTILAGHAAREQFDRAAEKAGFTPKIRFETESYDVAQALVGTGIGVALVSRLALTGVPGTAHRELIKPRPHRQLHAVTAADTTLTPLVDTFLDLLHDVAGDVPRPTTRPRQRYGGE
jgi:molybdate transport repressor ModE-like protein